MRRTLKQSCRRAQDSSNGRLGLDHGAPKPLVLRFAEVGGRKHLADAPEAGNPTLVVRHAARAAEILDTVGRRLRRSLVGLWDGLSWGRHSSFGADLLGLMAPHFTQTWGCYEGSRLPGSARWGSGCCAWVPARPKSPGAKPWQESKNS